MIAIIPSPDAVRLFRHPRILQQLVHFTLHEAEILIQTRVRNRIGHKIIGARKDAFFRNLQAACHHCKLKRLIVLQSLQ